MEDLDRVLYGVTRPARYTGGEWNSVVKDWDDTPLKIVLAYPDAYEIGMSNMAVPILYDLLNRQPDVLAERVYAPWVDMAEAMRRADIPLFSLESQRPVRDFDVIGFSLGYELTYTNVLNMLDLARIPLMAAERDDSCPFVIAGGSAALNPEPMSEFVDFFVLGDGEEVVLELLDVLRDWKRGTPRKDLLRRVAAVPGVYVPGLYREEYGSDGILKSFTPSVPEARQVIERRIVASLPAPPTSPVVPFIEVVHDRGAVEIQRGCSWGCRFCQAGMIYRPVRERSREEVGRAVEEIIGNCGYDEVSLVSLSTSDYPGIDTLVTELSRLYPRLAISLPSLRPSRRSIDLLDSLSSRRKMGFTFAPEAGSQRLRQVINKNISDEEMLTAAGIAIDAGWTTLKLYFMVGLPTETIEDVGGIVRMVTQINALAKKARRRPQIRVSVATFVPKPHTPFQWAGQELEDALRAKQDVLRAGLRQKGVSLSWSDPKTSLLEAVLSRGDRRLGKAIYQAWRLGAVFDAWNEHFNYATWEKAFADTGLDAGFYARRERSLDEMLPWGHVDVGVTADFLKREYQRALKGLPTRDCRNDLCNACGLQESQPTCREKCLAPGGEGAEPHP